MMPANPPIEKVRPAVLDREVARRIAEVRQRQGSVALRTGLAMALCAMALWLGAETTLDWFFALPWLVRALFFAAGAGGAGWLAWKVGVEPHRRPISEEAAALLIEREMPIFQSRFIASVQLSRAWEEHASPALIRALVAETASMAKTRNFRHVVKTAVMTQWVKAAAAAAILAAALWFIGGSASVPLLTRALLWINPVPRKTLISGVTGNKAVAIGDDVQIEANAGGIVPAHGRLLVATESGKKQEFPLEPDATKTHFARTLQGVQEPFTYAIELGDARTDDYRVKVKVRPGVLSIDCDQTFPAYTRLPPRRRATGDLKLLIGSRLSVKLKANAILKGGAIRLTGSDPDKVLKSAPMKPEKGDGKYITGEFEVTKEIGGMNLLLVDEDGVESKSGAVYRIEVAPDEPPTVAIRWPDRREELLTPGATMLLAFEAKDDFGVAKVRLHYAIDWAEGAKDSVIAFDLGGQTPPEVARRFEWKVGKLQPPPTEGQVLDYWLEVLDTNTATGPGVAVTEHYQARIVSELEKRADLANRLNDAMEGLDEVRQAQEDVSKRLGEIIFEKPAGTP